MPRKARLTEAQATALRADRDAGMTLAQLAERYRMSESGVRVYLGNLDKRTPVPYRKPVDWRKNVPAALLNSPSFQEWLKHTGAIA